ncbi:MAG: hypothetical protein WB792_07540 [Desulfobacterales bacterium]
MIVLRYVANSLVDGEGCFEFMKTSISDKSAAHKDLSKLTLTGVGISATEDQKNNVVLWGAMHGVFYSCIICTKVMY